jgi:hypothetical protein
MEAFFQTDFSGVRVHEGPAAQAMGALAFTLGEELHFAPGLYDPTSRAGVKLLGHELTHVVQQRMGRVANPYGQGVAIVQDPALEAEADRMGQQIADELWPSSWGGRLLRPARSPAARRSPAMQAKLDRGPSSRAIRRIVPQGALQRYIGSFDDGKGLHKKPWVLNGRKDMLMSSDKYPHLTILLTHLNEYLIGDEELWGLSFNQFHYSESHDDPNRVTFVETSDKTWQPLSKGQNYAKAKAAAALLMTTLGHNLVDDVYETWGKQDKPIPGFLDPEENDHVTIAHFFRK